MKLNATLSGLVILQQKKDYDGRCFNTIPGFVISQCIQ